MLVIGGSESAWASDAVASPALKASLIETLESNPEMIAARSRLDAAQALASAAGQPIYNPELDLEVENTAVQRKTVGLSQTIDWGNKRGARKSVATFEAEAARAEVDALQLTLSQKFITALADVEVDTALAELGQRRLAQTSELKRLTERRFQVGDIPRVDAYLAELAAAQARSLAAAAISDAAQARAALSSLTGSPSSGAPSLPADPPSVNPGLVDERTLARLPRQRAWRATVDAAEAGVTLKQRERRPDPTLRLAAGRDGNDNVTILALSIPLPVRNTYANEVTAARAQANAAGAQLSGDQRQARGAWIAAGERYLATRDAWIAWRTSSLISTDRLAATLRTLWQAGELSTGDYLTQLAQANEADAGGLELKRAVWHAYADWLEASGGVDEWILPASGSTQGKLK
jgi:cobalt-zinc-cadmium efflux system outer membrane protein